MKPSIFFLKESTRSGLSEVRTHHLVRLNRAQIPELADLLIKIRKGNRGNKSPAVRRRDEIIAENASQHGIRKFEHPDAVPRHTLCLLLNGKLVQLNELEIRKLTDTRRK